MNISPFKLLFRPSAALTAMLILAACSGGTTSTGLERGDGAAVAAGQPAKAGNPPANSPASPASSVAAVPKSAPAKPALNPVDYQLLYRMNAASNNGVTVRWPSRTIGVNRSDPTTRAAVSRWKGFNFRFGTNGINFQGDSQARRSCGWSRTAWRANGEIAWCRIWINSAAHQRRQCGSIASTITHEVGHCLGIQGHTADGGLMDPTAAGADVITAQASRTLTALYSLPAGSPVSTTARALSTGQSAPANTGLIIGPIIDYHGPH